MANEAAGFIEADGFVPIFDAVDAMVKATEVQVNGVMRLGGGLVAVAPGGDLATVEEAVEIGEETAKAVSRGKVRSIIFASPSRPVAAIANNPQLLDGWGATEAGRAGRRPVRDPWCGRAHSRDRGDDDDRRR